MYVVFTDLDGTMIDHETYSWEPAQPGIERLQDQDIPLVYVTSKTRSETEHWRKITGNRHPFIVENGGATYIPAGYFGRGFDDGIRRGAYRVIEWGTPYGALVDALKQASLDSGCEVRGFCDMPVSEVAERCGIPEAMARQAKRREYDEPFVVLDDRKSPGLAKAIEARGMRWTKGGRFWHILGNNDKGLAVRELARQFRQWRGDSCTVGLGDGLNDVPMFREVDIPVLISRTRGPAAWSEAILTAIPAHK